MTHNKAITRTLRASTAMSALVLVQAGLLANPAFAQEVQPTDGPPTDVSTPSGPVEGQPTPSTSAEGEPVDSAQDIVVTGSRIPQPNLESASPVSVVSDQDVKLSGATRVEDVLAQLPSATASQSSGVSNAATGTAEIDLRYLGAKRSLVLVNGRRLMPGSPSSASQAADINVIPASLLRRVEVLTGGASSVYGADAVAGVVNFIMDTEFEGIRFDGNYSFYQHNQQNPGLINGLDMRDIHEDAGFPFPRGSVTDGAAFDGTVSIGAGFDDDRGHAVAYFGYRKVKPVLQRDRDYSSCVVNGGTATTDPFCGGSATSGVGSVLTSDFSTIFDGTYYQFGPGRTLEAGPTLFNFAPLNYYQRPDERYTAGAFANYEISDQIKPYLEFMFMDDRTLAQIAPSGAFFGTVNTINCDSPLMSAQAQSIVCASGNLVTGFLGTYPSTNDAPVGDFNQDDPSTPLVNEDVPEAPFLFTDAQGNQFTRGFFQLGRRNVEGGPRIADLKHTAYRGVLGTRGDLSNVFSYDAYFQYGRTNYSLVYKNEFSISRLNRALNVVNVDANGIVVPVGTPGSSIVCRSVLDQTDPQCVPYDVFGTVSPEALNYLNIFGIVQGFTSEQIANANITAQLGEVGFRTPWAEDGVAVNFGAEYRKESLELNPDQSFQALPSSDLAGQGSPTLPTSGSFRVLEAFAEAQIPIVQDNFIDDFTINLGFRRSGYDLSNGNSFTTNTYKISAELAPVRDIRFRGAYNRAVRAPNIQELFGPQFIGLNGSIDPCADTPVTLAAMPDTYYGCLAQGMTEGQVTPGNPAEQYNGLIGGNPELRPEKATTKTIGVVLQPRFIPGLAVTVDYWNINLTGAVQGFGQDAILSDCVANATATFTPASCDLVTRDPAGSIWLSAVGFVTDLPNNQGGIKTDGVDANAAYRFDLGGMGSLSASLLGTWVRRYITDNGLTAPYDCAGFYGGICSAGTVSSSSPIPKWRHKLRTTWASPWGLGISAQWRHIGKVRHERTSDDETLNSSGNPPVLGRRVKAYNYLDLAATYTLLDRINLRAGVNNVFDKDPPRITSSAGSCPTGPCNGNTYPGTWDALGRYIWMGATIDFLPPKPMALAPPPVVAPPPPPPAAPATQTCPDGSVILATDACPAPPPPPPPPAPEPERG